MKQKETLVNIQLNDLKNKIELSDVVIDEMGNEHISTSIDTPMRNDAFVLTDAEKIVAIEKHFESIMNILGLDLTDDSLRGTPKRVAKMYVQEFFSGLNPANKPKATMFENKYGYKEMLVEKNISFYTTCEHHFVPFAGKAHVAYINNGQVIGLSKLNRIVQYFAKRPQVQERLTIQIGKELQSVLNSDDVAVILEAKHLCVASRGIKDDTSTTVTAFYGGAFNNEEKKTEFFKYVDFTLSM
ncbi:MAG: GTP cyclohydrolase I FolE [Chitinophagales bacterium]|nr:GTP cyclohydrolase I FolE [Chitinophagales bacterium]